MDTENSPTSNNDECEKESQDDNTSSVINHDNTSSVINHDNTSSVINHEDVCMTPYPEIIDRHQTTSETPSTVELSDEHCETEMEEKKLSTHNSSDVLIHHEHPDSNMVSNDPSARDKLDENKTVVSDSETDKMDGGETVTNYEGEIKTEALTCTLSHTNDMTQMDTIDAAPDVIVITDTISQSDTIDAAPDVILIADNLLQSETVVSDTTPNVIVIPDTMTQSEKVISDTTPDVVVISSDCTSDTAPQQSRDEICEHAENTDLLKEKCGVSHSMRYRDEESSTTDTSSDESGVSGDEGGSRVRRTTENTKIPKFTAPCLEDIRTRGEIFPEELPAIGELKISVNESVQIIPIGTVSSSVRVLVVIEPIKDLPVLDEDTILFTEDRKPFGKIFEVFGPVATPFYSVRFNSAEEIETKGIKPGYVVYYAPKVEEFTHYVFVEQLKRIKGTDASWENNNEPPDWCQEFSDDDDEKHTGRGQKHPAEDPTDCLPGAMKPGRPAKRKPERKEHKHGPRETKVSEKRQQNNHKPLTSWPPCSPDHHGYRPPPPASPHSFSPFGQQNMFPPRPFVSPSNFNNPRIPRHAPPRNQQRGPFPHPEQVRHQQPPQQHPGLHRPPRLPNGQHSIDQHRAQHPPGFNSMEFRPPFPRPGQPPSFNSMEQHPRPYMNQQQPDPHPMEQNWSREPNNPMCNDPATQNRPAQWGRPPGAANQSHQNNFQQTQNPARNSFPHDQCAPPRPGNDIVDTRLMWNHGGQGPDGQSSFGGGPRFEGGPIKPGFNPNPFQFQNPRPPYMGHSN